MLLVRALAGKPAFTDKDWIALCRHPDRGFLPLCASALHCALADGGCRRSSNWAVDCAARSVVGVRRPGIGCGSGCAGDAMVDDR